MGIKVSVIVPVFNTDKYLQQCLQSLLDQTLYDIEIICVNDGSADKSLDIIKKNAAIDSRIVVIDQKNYGQSAARNAGLKVARGEYVGFLDSDDWAEPQMFETLYRSAIRYNSDVVMSSIIAHDERTGATTVDDPYLSLKIFDNSFDGRAFDYSETFGFLFRICVVPWNKIFRRSKVAGFPIGVNFEDNVFNLESLIGAKISLVREPLVNYRLASETSYSFSGQDFKKLDFFKVMDLESEILKKYGIYDELKEYFEKSKKDTLIYWYKKLSTPRVKFLYALKFLLTYHQRIDKMVTMIGD